MSDFVNEPGQVLDWDSDFFGLRIGRLKVNRLAAELMPSIEAWRHAEKIECLYFLADPNDAETSRLASEHGFQFVDARITLELKLSADASSFPIADTIRHCRNDDLPALRDMAGRLHQDSRFFFDRRFNSALSGRMFEMWIEKSYSNPNGCVLVAESETRVAGYIACRQEDLELGHVDLVAVDDFAQGTGLGKKLISAAVQWFRAKGVQRAFVVTQERNIRAQRLYQRCGFITHSVELWYHRWFDPK